MFKSRLSAITLGIISASLLTVSSATYAAANYKGEGGFKETAPQQPMMSSDSNGLKDGFYIGAQVGYDSYHTHVVTQDTIDAADEFIFSHNPNAAGWVGGLFTGYGKYFNNYYLGGELFVNDSAASESDNSSSKVDGATSTYTSNVTVGGSYGIAILPGMKFGDSTLGYLRLGYNEARLKGKDLAVDLTGSVSSSKQRWEGGFAYGLGMETALCSNLSLRTDFTHTQYGSFHNSAGTKFEFADNQFMLGLNYHLS
jgi:outer membrane immunogenic protein